MFSNSELRKRLESVTISPIKSLICSVLTRRLWFHGIKTFSCASCGWRVCRGTGRRTCRARGCRAAACGRRRWSRWRRPRRRPSAPAFSKDNLSTDRVRGHVSHKPALFEPLPNWSQFTTCFTALAVLPKKLMTKIKKMITLVKTS